MQDDATRVESQTGSETEVQAAPEPTTATQEDTQQPSSTPDAGHGETQETGESATSSTPSQPDNSEPSVEILKKEYGKLRQTQEELKREREAKASLEKQTQALTSWMLSNEENARKALIEMDGRTEAEANAIIQDAKRKNPQLWATTQQAQPSAAQQPVDPYLAAQQVLDQREYVQSFFKTLPDLDPSTVKSDEDRQRKQDIAQRVDYLAGALRSVDPGLTRDAAWVEAYKVVTKKTDADIEAAREAGRVEGLTLANADKASNRAPSNGAQVNQKATPGLTPEERSAAAKLGMSEADYAEWKERPGMVD